VETGGHKLSATVSAAVKGSEAKEDSRRVRDKEKADRATSEQVLDPRTRMVIFKMLNKGFLKEIHGCVSTGKEANVYHSFKENGEEIALKIYKTSILIFKDRDRYVTGEHRFRKGYSKHNPRKMVRVWAEKEMRNLTRLHKAGINCPQPILLRLHVLLMQFLGTDGWAAPKLKDVQLPESRWAELYETLVKMMRRMYHDCKLVHADLSEYNILYFKNEPYIIDVGQAVEHDHPHALDFLRTDICNVTDFFAKKSVFVLRPRGLFDFVTDVNITDATQEAHLRAALEKLKLQPTEVNSIEEEVFRQSFIPRTLDQVLEPERDVRRAAAGDTKDILYTKITGLRTDLTGGARSSDSASATPASTPAPISTKPRPPGKAALPSESSASSVAAPPPLPVASPPDKKSSEASKVAGADGASDSEEEDDDEDGSSSEEEGPEGQTAGGEATPLDKKAWKKKVKEENREKRKTKIPKHLKKQKIKNTTTKKKR
jgi:RIO kinase 1